jgi:hypothetical protein
MVIAQFWAFANDIYTPEQASINFADESFPVGRCFRSGAICGRRLLDDVAAQQVLARRVDNVQNHGEERDEEEIAILANQLERAFFAERLLRGHGILLSFTPRCDSIDGSRNQRANDQDGAPADQESSGSSRGDQRPGAHRSEPGAEAAADADQWKQALAPARDC